MSLMEARGKRNARFPRRVKHVGNDTTHTGGIRALRLPESFRNEQTGDSQARHEDPTLKNSSELHSSAPGFVMRIGLMVSVSTTQGRRSISAYRTASTAFF